MPKHVTPMIKDNLMKQRTGREEVYTCIYIHLLCIDTDIFKI